MIFSGYSEKNIKLSRLVSNIDIKNHSTYYFQVMKKDISIWKSHSFGTKLNERYVQYEFFRQILTHSIFNFQTSSTTPYETNNTVSPALSLLWAAKKEFLEPANLFLHRPYSNESLNVVGTLKNSPASFPSQ